MDARVGNMRRDETPLLSDGSKRKRERELYVSGGWRAGRSPQVSEGGLVTPNREKLPSKDVRFPRFRGRERAGRMSPSWRERASALDPPDNIIQKIGKKADVKGGLLGILAHMPFALGLPRPYTQLAQAPAPGLRYPRDNSPSKSCLTMA